MPIDASAAQEAAKRIYAMLDLAEAADAFEFDAVDRQIGRIRSAAGPAAAIVVPNRHVRTCADMLYRTRTLVTTRIAPGDLHAMERAVTDGAAEVELRAPGGIALDVLTRAAQRRNVKLACPDDMDIREALGRFDAARIRFAIVSDAPDPLRQAAKTIVAAGFRLGLKVTGCQTLAACQAVYDTISDAVGEAWIWPGTLRFDASETLHDDIVGHLRDRILSRPVGCGVRPDERRH
ncbi:hypothetical protein IQ03_04912 [Gemmobacter caeni]|uniref:HpcH/HpaI aldolase/citrate lyase domain-containing protein n=1 Tax=Gemmobacter caeni TaxID=589035 RepID=A0A2T6ADA9_9RHOB|nr:hypothetical protein [Gemmobacter caeni]PTX41803.1 hypothetical protein C8N34_1278 [Gemmobacter caeni]TWI90634.1 hypothetical protein IQ03_04912 [Gemmobacter caeni]